MPDIFGKQDQEVFITYWLAYLLDPNVNGFGVEPLNALLRCIEAEPLSSDDDVVVIREFTFAKDGRRIDLLITTPSLIIGIENKLYSGELVSQTKSYWAGMADLAKSQHEGKTIQGIYLKPEANRAQPDCKDFHTLTYTDFVKSLRQIEYDYRRDHRKNFFFHEFILYVEDKLMLKSNMGFPVMREDAKLYCENRNIIDAAQRSYKHYIKEFGDWLSNQLSQHDDRFKAKTPAATYWQIVESDQWLKLNFHYELYWGRSKKDSILNLSDYDEVDICIHLESPTSNIRGRIMQFESSLPSERISVSFKSEEEAEESIRKIVAILRSEEFQKFAIRANKCIQ